MNYTSSNVNYGYCVATNQDYVAIGNPSVFIYDSSSFQTGSVEVLQYSNQTDSYTHNSTIRKYLYPDVLLSTELDELIKTDTGSNPSLTSSFILMDYGDLPLSASKFGKSVAIYENTIVIGDPLFYYRLNEITSSYLTGSSVDIFELSTSETASYVTALNNTFESSYDFNTTFGESVSIYNNFLAVGASSVSSSQGVVYLYKKISDEWTYYQLLTGSNVSGAKFGSVVKIDQSGSYNIVVGNGAISGSVYVFNYNSSSGYWIQGAILNGNRNLTSSLQEINNNWPPYITSSENPDGFGNSVAIYGTNIVVGAPNDTYYYQYNGSDTYRHRGAAYFFENCTGNLTNWSLIQKTFGSEDLLLDNYFGWDVEVYETSSIISSLKKNFPFSSSYLENTLYKRFDCNPNDDIYNVLGQYVLYQKTTESLWNIVTTITQKKKYGEPYSVYGYDTAIYNTSIVVGSPTMMVYHTESSGPVVTASLSFIFDNIVDDDGTGTGGALAIASGGTPPYTYDWQDIAFIQPFQSTDTLSASFGPSDWQFTLTDNVGSTTSSILHIYRAAYTSSTATIGTSANINFPSNANATRSISNVSKFDTSSGDLQTAVLMYSIGHRTNYSLSNTRPDFPATCSWNVFSLSTSSLKLDGTLFITSSTAFGYSSGSSSQFSQGIVNFVSTNTSVTQSYSLPSASFFTGSGNFVVAVTASYPAVTNTGFSSSVNPSTPQNNQIVTINYIYIVPRQ